MSKKKPDSPKIKIITFVCILLTTSLAVIDRVIPWISESRSDSTDTTTNEGVIPNKEWKIVGINVYDADTDESLSNVNVELRTSLGVNNNDKTGEGGYVELKVLDQDELQDILRVRLSKEGYISSTTPIDITLQRSSHNIFLKKRTTEPNSSSSSVNTTPNINTNNIPLINGFWNIEMKVTNDTDVHKTGRIRKEKLSWLTFFDQENNEFKGYIVNGSDSACAGKDETSITGSIEGKSVFWKVKYIGVCCNKAEMSFAGEFISSTGAIEGKLEPTKEHSSKKTCTLVWANVSMKPGES